MTRAAFRQADIERILRAAKATGSIVQIDIKTLVCTILPPSAEQPQKAPPLVRDGKENWDDDQDWSHYRPVAIADTPPPIQPELDHREHAAMIKLIELGVGEKLHLAGTRGFGPGTQRKLSDRGYIEIIHQPGGKFQDDEVSLTKKGLTDWKAQKAYIAKNPFF